MEFFTESMDYFVSHVVHGGFHVHVASLIFCVIIGIFLLQTASKVVFRIIARNNDELYNLLREICAGTPTLLGILGGIYVAQESLAIPPHPAAFLEHIFHAILIMTIALVVAHMASGYLKYKLGKSSEQLVSTSILVTTIDITVYAIGGLVLLESLGVAISPLLTALGIGGLATALALQDTLANLFSGINTLLSKQVKIGDFVKLSSGEAGHIIDMNWRNTTIKTTTENMIVVPNQKIASSVIINYAQPFAACSILIPIGVGYGSDLDHVEAVTLEVAKKVLLDNEGGAAEFEPLVRYRDFGDYSIHFDVVLRVKTIMDQNYIRHQFIKAIYDRYGKEKIMIPVKNAV